MTIEQDNVEGEGTVWQLGRPTPARTKRSMTIPIVRVKPGLLSCPGPPVSDRVRVIPKFPEHPYPTSFTGTERTWVILYHTWSVPQQSEELESWTLLVNRKLREYLLPKIGGLCARSWLSKGLRKTTFKLIVTHIHTWFILRHISMPVSTRLKVSYRSFNV